ncbi:protoheme IX farnesyltransferase [Pontibacillus yanchengensis]|uniref:Protoheme IX farnesyltransferase n=2 Tax=Pontibacillus yanchengensis TaxID=462910 RepID=A0ACC7VBU4_9BACI|nr:heme o synthase [Pontibacillus yanchengensis]MYL33003.1 protoheme IX farnesyltransferase [Pontibacillus yanchengensis]MYL52147.1 protoheme IX farnesyltransferase [Pontibacillus yanchengensis]
MNNPRTMQSTAQVLKTSTDEASASTLGADILSLIKIGIINSNLMTTFAGFWLALYFTGASFFDHWHVFLLTMLGTAFIIAGGCIINNYYDRDIDKIMSRTQSRPTVTGTITLKNILIMGIGVTLLGLSLLSFTTWTAALLAAFGWFTYVVLYTMWSKRKYTLNTVVGSFSGAVPPLIGWAALDPGLHPVAWGLFLIMFIWQTPHFLALAMKKCEEYKKAGIPMLPVVHGFSITKRQIVLYVACLLPLPFYLHSLGTVFLLLATILTVGWLAIGIAGFFMKDDMKWATWMFVYSLNYLTILFIAMVIATLPFSY